MAERMQRTQILLKPTQHAWLAETARSEERSISYLIREMVDRQILDTERQAEVDKQRRLAALENIAQRREKMLEEMGGEPISGEDLFVINQMREERSAELIETLAGRR